MISAIILAAGKSRRMGEQKLLMRWGDTTVIEHVISVFVAAGLDEILVVTGSHRRETESTISAMQINIPVKNVFNEEFSTGEMLSSIQCGLRELSKGLAKAALIALGDQPQVRRGSVRMVCEAFRQRGGPLVVPSFQMRRGHPWLVEKRLWGEILELHPPHTPRDFLNKYSDQIKYVKVNDPGILADFDTPEEYAAAKS